MKNKICTYNMHIKNLPYIAKELINLFALTNRHNSKLLKIFNKICDYKVSDYSDKRLKRYLFCYLCGYLCAGFYNTVQCFEINMGIFSLYKCFDCEKIDKQMRDNRFYKNVCSCSSIYVRDSDDKYEIYKKTASYKVTQTVTCRHCKEQKYYEYTLIRNI